MFSRWGLWRAIILEVDCLSIIYLMNISISLYIRYPPAKYKQFSSILKRIIAKSSTMVILAKSINFIKIVYDQPD